MMLTEAWIAKIARDKNRLREGRELVSRAAFQALGADADGRWIWALCQGSAPQPYAVKIYLDFMAPQFHCDCPSHVQPCKHVVGLLFARLATPSAFETTNAPRALRYSKLA